MASTRPSRAILYLTALAAPVALGFETVLRHLLFPPEFEQFRAFLEPVLTPFAWVLGLLAGAASLAGFALQRRLTEKRLARVTADDVAIRHAQVLGVFLLTASVPQIPAILSTFAFMFGASIAPVLAGIAICTAGVVAQAMRVEGLSAIRAPR
jgi:hypothetical protein